MKRFSLNIILLLFSFFLLGIPSAFTQSYSFDKYNVEEGLSQSNVTGIVQDKEGYLWFATESGLSRFDGKTFTTYSTSDGIADNNISCLLLSTSGEIIMGHSTGAFTIYNGKKFESVNTGKHLKDKKIYSLYQDKKGELWASIQPHGIVNIKNILDTNTYTIFTGKEGLSGYVFDMRQTKDSALWFANDIGLKVKKPGQSKFDFFKVPDLPPTQVVCILEDKKENLWFGTYSSGEAILANYNPRTNKTILYKTPSFVSSMFEDSQGNLWISCWGTGLLRFNGNEMKLFSTENGLVANKIRCIFEDREKNIILGSFGNGAAIFRGEKFAAYTEAHGLLRNQVLAVAQDKQGNIWMGTSEGLSVYDTDAKKFTNYDKINGKALGAVKSLSKDEHGNIWIATIGQGVFKYNAYDGSLKPFNTIADYANNYFFNCIYVDKNNNIWAGSSDGLIFYDQTYGMPKAYRMTDGLAGNDISFIFEDSRRNIWVGSKGRGLSRSSGSKFKVVGKDDGFTHNSPSTMAEDKSGKLWIGTEGGGIFTLEGGKFNNIRSKDGLVSDFISLTTIDSKNNIWIGTNKGLNKYDPASQTFYTYTKYDGFTALETKQNAVLKDENSNIWFGTASGVSVYNPAFDKVNLTEPQVNFTRIYVNNKPIYFSLSKEVELGYKENNLRFDIIGICISNPNLVKYKVMLKNFDPEFSIPSTVTNYTYNNLRPGHYELTVLASNNAAVWNEKPLVFRFYIAPPWYTTWWAFVLYIVVGVSSFVSYVKWREQKLVKEKKVLEEKVNERTAEVVEKNKQLDEKNKDIMASIRYAKRIQDAILPPKEFVEKYLPKTFVLYKPKDIVSGDFYWAYNYHSNEEKRQAGYLAEEPGDVVLFAACDCTGHGVPGAFMSIVGHNHLDQIVGVQNIIQPAAILDALNKSVSDTLRQSYSEEQQVKDGMDITLCSFNRKTNILEFAGAFNPLYLIQKGELKEVKGSKFPIGNLKVGEEKKFTNHSFTLEKGDTVYIFSDGFADQFGGPNGKKFKYKQLQELLLSIQDRSMEDQKSILNKTIEDWKGNLEQVDDILIIGTRL